MIKQLNVALIEETAEQLGLTQTAIADGIGVTRAAVSKWVKGKSFPRPPELLKLGKLLGLGYKDLVQNTNAINDPLVAFRKRGASKTTPKHIGRAKDMGKFLEPLVEYLHFDKFVGPPSLKNPSTDYRYLQQLVLKIRHELNLSASEPIEFEVLIQKFNEHQAVLVPTLWGKKDKHENALHIFLPKTKTTWIFINLDSEVHDFKFWMAHELGHVLSVTLLEQQKIEDAENFADAFAGALLFPESAAKSYLPEYRAARSNKGRLHVLLKAAGDYLISPYSVFKELEKYALDLRLSFAKVDDHLLHASIANFNKNYKTVSESLFDGQLPTADHFMQVTQRTFGTEFYTALGDYLNEKKIPASAVSRIMDVSLMDGRAFHEALTSINS